MAEVETARAESLSARRAWIEMTNRRRRQKRRKVALRKESVDRNFSVYVRSASVGVALRKESVDRNDGVIEAEKREALSLSARRAWIEIRHNIKSS